MYDQFGMSADDQVNMGQGGENPFGDMGGFGGGGGGMGDFFNQGGMGQQQNFDDMFKDFDEFFGMGGGMGGKKAHRSVKGQDIFLN